jgi:hypothetical protein
LRSWSIANPVGGDKLSCTGSRVPPTMAKSCGHTPFVSFELVEETAGHVVGNEAAVGFNNRKSWNRRMEKDMMFVRGGAARQFMPADLQLELLEGFMFRRCEDGGLSIKYFAFAY